MPVSWGARRDGLSGGVPDCEFVSVGERGCDGSEFLGCGRCGGPWEGDVHFS